MYSSNPILPLDKISLPRSLYVFVFTTKFLMLFLFLTTAHILVFLKASLIYFVSNNYAVSSLKIASIFVFSSSAEPGKMQHTFSSSFAVWGESTVNLAGIDIFILVDRSEGRIAIELLFESNPFRLSSSTKETILPSSSETTSAAPSELSMLVYC